MFSLLVWQIQIADDIIQGPLSQQVWFIGRNGSCKSWLKSMLLLARPTSSSFDSLSLRVMFVWGFGTGNSTLWGTGLIADGKFGYWTVCLEFAVTPVDTGQAEVAVWNMVRGLSPNHRNGEGHTAWTFWPMPRDAWHTSHNKNGEPNSCPDHPLCSRNNAHSIS